jgi:hypothetical protein
MQIQGPTITRVAMPLFAALAFAAPARADGTTDPAAARAACEKAGHAGTREQLRACCDDQILADPPAKQARLVARCVQGDAPHDPQAPTQKPAQKPARS